jgi:RND family efflux transporter MFP subunit
MNKQFVATLMQPSIILSIAGFLAVASVVIAFASSSRRPTALYVSPSAGQIVQEIDTTGTVQAATSLDLSFQSSGQISYVHAPVGSQVAAGATLARLSSADLAAQLEAAKASLAMQQAKLAGLESGASAQTVGAAHTSVENAQNQLAQASTGVVTASQNAYTQADDAIHNRVDALFSNPRTLNPTLNLTLNDSQLSASIVSDRQSMENLLAQWKSYEQSLSSDADPSAVASTVSGYANQVSSYLDEVAAGLTAAIPTTNYPLAAIQTYQTSIATARANMAASLVAINTADSSYTAAKSGLAAAQASLSVTTAPAQSSDLEAQQAAVQAAQAQVDLVGAQIGHTIISAPISGTITVDNAHVGETAAAGATLISMISDTQFQMVVYVSNADIAKVKVGNEASIALDAYQGGSVFAAHVIEVDPAATIQNGVSAYKVTLQFDKNDPLIQAGMTGSAHIITQMHQNSLSVPTSAIITRGSEAFVIVQSSRGDKQVPVQIGIASASGMTEIISGLSASERVRTFGSI